jgi:phosphomannomutase
VKVTTPDGWFLVRGSNTEPIIRVVAEAKSEERAREMVSHVINGIA